MILRKQWACKLGEKLFPNLNEEVQKQVLKECCEQENVYLEQQGGHLYKNVVNVIEKLSQRYKLYIVSNCQDGYIEAFYKYHGLEEYFLDYENPGRTGLSKGENIKLMIERNNLLDAIYVGDTNGDLKAARYAGIPFVYAKYGFGEVSEYDYVIEDFAELLNIF
ncbi:HAD-IA family hydrolase [Alkalibacillus silvisoli]|uniref:HAD family hydrolase n=1 Tax=Alkalibacillus silvisoli TaxID=392823 RepID=A0ABN0ZXN8_9BACI